MDLNKLKQPDLSKLFDRDVRTIQRWTDDGMPRHGTGVGGYYVWSEVLPWFIRRVSGVPEDQEGLSDRQRRDRAQADLAEMERDRLAGTLIDAAAAEREWASRLASMRARLLAIPHRVAPLLATAATNNERAELVRREVYEALESLAGPAPKEGPPDMPEALPEEEQPEPKKKRGRPRGSVR